MQKLIKLFEKTLGITYSKALVRSKALKILSKLPLSGRGKLLASVPGEVTGAQEVRLPIAVGPHR